MPTGSNAGRQERERDADGHHPHPHGELPGACPPLRRHIPPKSVELAMSPVVTHKPYSPPPPPWITSSRCSMPPRAHRPIHQRRRCSHRRSRSKPSTLTASHSSSRCLTPSVESLTRRPRRSRRWRRGTRRSLVLNQLPQVAVFGRSASMLPLAFVLFVTTYDADGRGPHPHGELPGVALLLCPWPLEEAAEQLPLLHTSIGTTPSPAHQHCFLSAAATSTEGIERREM